MGVTNHPGFPVSWRCVMLSKRMDIADQMQLQNTFHDVLKWIERANKDLDVAVLALEEIASAYVGTFDERAGDMQEVAQDALRRIRGE